ncbi:MAG: DnaJ domain-containing protein [Roseiflexaceae bacterium]
MGQDYYELLQVHPRADAAAIRAAYERLRVQYDPERLAGAADELIEIARTKLATIEQAYTILADPQQRAAYDREFAARADAPKAVLPLSTPEASELDQGEQALLPDYRPLPPAQRGERPRKFAHEPIVAVPQQPPNVQFAIAILAVLIVAVVGVSLLITNWSTIAAPPATAAVPTPTISILDEYERLIAEARQATEQTPNDPEVWITLGNQLYDSAQIVRENMPDSTLYEQRIPRWLEASQAYERALALQPDNPLVLADMGVSLCYFGVGVGDQSFVSQGTANVQQAVEQQPGNPLIQLHLGSCLISSLPPKTSEAIAAWQRVTELAPADSAITQRAFELIQQYQR